MKKTTTLLLLLLGLSASAFAQHAVRGVVYDAQTKQPVAYPIVQVGAKQIGIVGDAQGGFSFENKLLAPTDSVAITCMGYRKTEMTVGDFASGAQNIAMSVEPFSINAVVITPRTKTLKIGTTGKGAFFTPLFVQKELQESTYIGREFGTTLKIKRTSSIESLNFSIAKNRYDSLKFRVLFYRVADSRPTEFRINQEIIFDVKNGQTDWFSLDLTPYGIQFEQGEEVAITLMTLNETDRHEFWIHSTPLGGGGLLRRDAVLGEWSRSGGGISLYLGAKY